MRNLAVGAAVVLALAFLFDNAKQNHRCHIDVYNAPCGSVISGEVEVPVMVPYSVKAVPNR